MLAIILKNEIIIAPLSSSINAIWKRELFASHCLSFCAMYSVVAWEQWKDFTVSGRISRLLESSYFLECLAWILCNINILSVIISIRAFQWNSLKKLINFHPIAASATLIHSFLYLLEMIALFVYWCTSALRKQHLLPCRQHKAIQAKRELLFSLINPIQKYHFPF